jgi:uncharacterized protein (UPF0261 family)
VNAAARRGYVARWFHLATSMTGRETSKGHLAIAQKALTGRALITELASALPLGLPDVGVERVRLSLTDVAPDAGPAAEQVRHYACPTRPE